MKKLCLLIVGILLLQGLGLATAESDDFPLRSGIRFGDTIDVIAEKETTLTRKSEDSATFVGTIAGYSDASCSFTFNDDGALVGMEYSFDTSVCPSRDIMNEVYKTLYQSLLRKYGRAIGNTGGNCELITGPALVSMSLVVYLLGSVDGYDADYTNYDEWIVDTNRYHVKIDLVSFYYRDADYIYHYFVNLSYLRYTDEEYQNALQQKKEEREAVDNDL